MALLGFLMAGTIPFACASKSVPAAPLEEKPAEVAVPVAKPDWKLEWDNTLEKAKKEGKLSLYAASGNAAARDPFIHAVKDKFRIDLEMVTARGAELSTKIFTERRAGLFLVDVYMGGGSAVVELKPAGVFDSLEPQLLLPEVLDPGAWWEGRLPFTDKDKKFFAMAANPSPPYAINTSLVSREEVNSYLDLLNPKWKGKMILNDPSISGTSLFWFGAASTRIMDLDYMKKLAQMDLAVTRDQRLVVEQLARGRYHIGISPNSSLVGEFREAGASLELITPKEGTYVTSSSANVAIVNKAPHPDAAKLFINWLLSKEGQTVLSPATSVHSARLDVPTAHLPSDRIRSPGVKYYSVISEEFYNALPEHARKATEIFGPLMK